MDATNPSTVDLAGDPALIARAEQLRPAVEALSDEIEEGRRLPPAPNPPGRADPASRSLPGGRLVPAGELG